MIRIPVYVTNRLYAALHDGQLHSAWASGPEAEHRLRFLLHLLLTAIPDEHGRGLLFGIDSMAAVLGYPKGHGRKDLDLRGFLARLQADLPDGALLVSGHEKPTDSGESGKATAIEHVDIPDAVRFAADYDREHFHDEELRHYFTGAKQRLDRERSRVRRLERTKAEAQMPADTPQSQADLVKYLNARHSRFFTEQVEARVAAVMEKLSREPEARRVPLTGLVRHMIDQPVPLYTTKARTQRVVQCGAGLHTAPSWMRRLLLRDAIELDAAQAQLALAAGVWDVPEVRGFLASGASFWDDLIGYLVGFFPCNRYDAEEDFDAVKSILKTTTYSVCFGMSKRNIVRFGDPERMGPKDRKQREADHVLLCRVFGAQSAEEVGRAFVFHPLIAALLRARDARMKAVKADGGLTDIFGRCYTIGETITDKKVTARSCLAAEMQAAEAYVMGYVARVFLDEEARAKSVGTRAEAEIVLWQFDGFTMRLRRGASTTRGGREADRWIERAEAALQDGCRALEAELGCPTVHTHLEVKYDPRSEKASSAELTRSKWQQHPKGSDREAQRKPTSRPEKHSILNVTA